MNDKFILSRMDSNASILQKITDEINESEVSWSTIAFNLGIEESVFKEIRKQRNPVKCFVNSLTKRIWYDILHHFEIELENSNVETLPGIQKLFKILYAKDQSCNITSQSQEELQHLNASEHPISDELQNTENEKMEEYPHHVNIIYEISQRITQWRQFGRILDLEISYLNSLETMYQECSEKIRRFNRNKDIMMEALKTFKSKNKPSDGESWKFWSVFLMEFDNGREIIKEMQREFPFLIRQVSSDTIHTFTSKKISFIGHPIQFDNVFEIQKSNSEVAVNIGSNKVIHYQDIQEWTETQKRYMDIFNIFKDKTMFNFHDLNEYCPILNTLGQYLNDTSDYGFAVKGYHPIDHLKWFDKSTYVDDYDYEHYFCLFAKENLIINFTKCNEQPGHALHYSSQKIQIMNALHKELQSKDIIQVNVLVYNDDTNIEFCPVCIDENLYVKESILSDIEKFKEWFNKLHNILHKLRHEANLSTDALTNERIENLKKEVTTYEALQNNEVLPSFSRHGETQMNEMKKCVILPTLVQFTILHMNEKHVFVRGSYGSGKTIVVRKKFEKCLGFVKEKDIFYYICGDQQSDYKYSMDSIKSEHPDKNIITCDSKTLVNRKHPPTLSAILKHIHHFWKDKTVHVFIDEFSGSHITKEEVSELKKILPHFSDSYITIALQSMEEYSDADDETDFGYQYDLLINDTSFKLRNLDYSLRCSAEINEFVKITSDVLEKHDVPVFQVDNFTDREGRFVDKEHGQEHNFSQKQSGLNTKKFHYNLAQKSGHSSLNGPVSLFMCDKFTSSTSSTSERSTEPNVKSIHQVYLTVLEYILTDFSHLNTSIDKRKVICTYDNNLYDSVYHYLNTTKSHCWTNDIKTFIKNDSPYDILLTDYASVRGYEFTNFIFLLRFGKRFLKYRMIECFTRATTKLCIITDNMNEKSDRSSDNLIFKEWKSIPHECVTCYVINYDSSKDKIQIGNDIIRRKVSVVGDKIPNKYPWRQPKKIEKESVVNDLHETIDYLCANDNIDVLLEFMKVQQLDVFNYRVRLDESLLHTSSRMGGFNITQYLLSHYPFDVNVRDQNQRSPLHHASENGHVDVVHVLINNNADINMKHKYGRSPLHDASFYGRVDVVHVLIKNNADINIKDVDGQSPLHDASFYGHVDVVHVLIKNNADINMQDVDGRSPLHCASRHGHVDVVHVLINNNADINMQDVDGRSPLHDASEDGRVDVVHVLINNNADINMQDEDGFTPLDLARQWNNHETVRLLEQHISQEK